MILAHPQLAAPVENTLGPANLTPAACRTQIDYAIITNIWEILSFGITFV